MSNSIYYPPGGHYYEEEEVELICEMLDRGYERERMVAILMEYWQDGYNNASYQRQRCRDRIDHVAGDRWNWSTTRDPIAMELAFLGSRYEWENLNYYERRDVVLRLQALLDNNIRHPVFHHRDVLDGGLSEWAEAVGCVDVQYITNPFGRRKRIRAAIAEAQALASVHA